MGYGKTTAVRGFLKANEITPLWITYYHPDEGTAYFWSKFTALLARIDESAAQRLEALGFPAAPFAADLALDILSGVSFPEKTVLVIDDYHLVGDLSLGRFFTQLTRESPEQFHLVIITRDTTRIDFTELLAKGFCAIVSQKKLKFSDEETALYCRRMQSAITDDDIKKINAYTDGWISLIYMILFELENGIPVGRNDSIDTLVENVLYKPYDERIRKFLLQLSVLDVFTEQQAAFLTGEAKAGELLRKLRRENAFVYYDPAAKTYKIHNVLLDFLRQKQDFTDEENRLLQNRCGELRLKDGEFLAAYGCFMRAGNAERILSHLNEPENIRNELTSFNGSAAFFNALPKELLYRYPLAYLQHILLTIVRGDKADTVRCAQALDRLEAHYQTMETADTVYRNHILAEIRIFRRFTQFNIIDENTDDNAVILRLLNGEQSYIMTRDNECTFGSPHLLYIYFRDAGSFEKMKGLVRERFLAYADFANGCGTGSEFLAAAEFELETGSWDAAELNALRAIHKAMTKEQLSIVICANFTLIRLALIRGKVNDATALLRQIEQTATRAGNTVHITSADLCKGYFYACIGQAERIPAWLLSGDAAGTDLLYQGVAFNCIVYGKAGLLAGDYRALKLLTERLAPCYALYHNHIGFLHNQILRAVAVFRTDGAREGETEMRKALELARPDRLVLPILEYGIHVLALLERIAEKSPQDRFAAELLAGSRQYAETVGGYQPVSVQLSQRELEVLRLTADGFKREEIAARLFVSQSTVKTHLQNIYQKLGVSGKISAIKTARLNGWI
ncbi:MAG: LuxR C-terminal-related transcriptional regulator [Oscillospiraceae bacterium]